MQANFHPRPVRKALSNAAPRKTDVLILGAGAAGLMCAREASAHGLDVVLLERAPSPGRKLCISGGGKANFTTGRLSTLPQFTPEALKHNMPLPRLIRSWAGRKQCTMSQFAIAWLLAQAPWIAPIPGTTNPAHLDDFLGGAAVSLTREELEEFEREYSGITLMGHRADAFTESQIDK